MHLDPLRRVIDLPDTERRSAILALLAGVSGPVAEALTDCVDSYFMGADTVREGILAAIDRAQDAGTVQLMIIFRQLLRGTPDVR